LTAQIELNLYSEPRIAAENLFSLSSNYPILKLAADFPDGAIELSCDKSIVCSPQF